MPPNFPLYFSKSSFFSMLARMPLPRMAPLVGAMLGLAVSASYYQILHFRHVWAFFAVIAALYLWGRREAA